MTRPTERFPPASYSLKSSGASDGGFGRRPVGGVLGAWPMTMTALGGRPLSERYALLVAWTLIATELFWRLTPRLRTFPRFKNPAGRLNASVAVLFVWLAGATAQAMIGGARAQTPLCVFYACRDLGDFEGMRRFGRVAFELSLKYAPALTEAQRGANAVRAMLAGDGK